MSEEDKEIISSLTFNRDGRDKFSEQRKVFSRESPETIVSSWGNGFTDPKQHNEDRFRYLIYGMQGKAGDLVQMIHVIRGLIRGEGQNIGEKIDLLMQPDRIGDKTIISASVIDQRHRVTFGNAGLILRTPFQNILDVSPEDLGTDFVNPDRVIVNSQRNICTVEELIGASNPSKWNEVRLVGTTEAGKVSVEGFWIKVNEEGKPLDEETARDLMDLAERDGRPLVKIVEKVTRVEFKDSKPEIHEWPEAVAEEESTQLIEVPWAFSFNRNKQRYFLDFERGHYLVVTAKNQSKAMSPEEFAYAMSILESELDPKDKGRVQDILSKLPEKFAQANKPK